MSDDLSEFHDVFFEEADELIESMEAELLEMLTDPEDPERINTVFRAAHSIKGGSATFGFSAVAEFTHVMETLMDDVREGTRKAEPDLVDLLLKATDCVRGMLEAAKADEPVDAVLADQLRSELEAQLGPKESSAAGAESESSAAGAESPVTDDHVELTPNITDTHSVAAGDKPQTIYKIYLRPARDSFRTANDPLLVLAELEKMGDLSVTLDADDLPVVEEFDAEDLYLAWRIVLTTHAEEDEVRGVFEWIDANSEINIEVFAPRLDVVVNNEVAVEEVAVLEAETPPVAPPTADATHTADATQKKPADKNKSKGAPVSSIRVGIDKIDKLINLVGELVITQSMLNEEGGKLPGELAEKLHEGLTQLQRYTRELQENVMQIRMVPISNAFNRLPRMIHDLTGKLGKKVDLKMTGEQTELDKTVLESIGDPLVHLVRNAVDHGIEMPDVRATNGKDETGEIQLNAYHENGSIIIEIRDDGGGINCETVLRKAREKGLVGPDDKLSDPEVFDLLFHPGFSMAEQISDVSGRGVGMDVVRRNIQSLGGSVEVNSRLGEGSNFTIRLPLTLAIVDGQLVRVGDQTFVLPLISIVESIQLDQSQISAIAGVGVVYRLRDEYMPLMRLANLFSLMGATNQESLVVVVETDGGKVGLLVDDLLAQQQVVIKSLESNYRRVDGVAGATILGDGTVALILDIDGVNSLSKAVEHSDTIAA